MIFRLSSCRTALASRSASVSFIAVRYSSRKGVTQSTAPNATTAAQRKGVQSVLGLLLCQTIQQAAPNSVPSARRNGHLGSFGAGRSLINRTGVADLRARGDAKVQGRRVDTPGGNP